MTIWLQDGKLNSRMINQKRLLKMTWLLCGKQHLTTMTTCF
jgi:hypothetical protein